jgi:hypothetical protein
MQWGITRPRHFAVREDLLDGLRPHIAEVLLSALSANGHITRTHSARRSHDSAHGGSPLDAFIKATFRDRAATIRG